MTSTRKKLVERHHDWKAEAYKGMPANSNSKQIDENGNLIRPKYLSNHTHYTPTDSDARVSVRPGVSWLGNGIELEELLADGGYSSGEALAYLHEKNINAYIPNFGQYKSEREGFTYHKEEAYYRDWETDRKSVV